MNYNIMTPEEAATLIQDGDTISFSGFSSTGTPPMSLDYCFDFHKEFRKSGNMQNTRFD